MTTNHRCHRDLAVWATLGASIGWPIYGAQFAPGWTQLGTDAANSLVTANDPATGLHVCPDHPYDPTIYSSNIAGNYLAAEGCNAVPGAWGGGALRTSTNQMVLFGGGHGDYGGDEIYTIDFFQSPAVFHRPFGPMLPGPNGCISGIVGLPVGSGCTNGSLAPNSRHSYGGLAYIPANADASLNNPEEMLIYGGSLASGSGGANGDMWMYNFATNSWKCLYNPGGAVPGCGTILSTSSSYPRDQNGSFIEWEPADKAVYIFSTNNGLGVYNPSSTSPTVTFDSSSPLAANTYRALNYSGALQTPFTFGAIDHTHKILVQIGFYGEASPTDAIFEYNLVTAAASTNLWTGSGCPSKVAGASTYAGMAWDNTIVASDGTSGSLVLYYPSGGSAVWIYDQPTHKCTQMAYGAAVGSVAPPVGASDIFNKFQYVPAQGYFVLIRDGTEAPWILCRKSGGCGGSGTTVTVAPSEPTGLQWQ